MDKNLTLKKISELFDNPNDAEPLFDINLDNLTQGRTEYQIKNFVLNKREFTNPWAVLQQTKLELHNIIWTLYDLRYRYKVAENEIKLAKVEIDELEDSSELSEAKKRAKIERHEIEIEKSQTLMLSIKTEALKKLREVIVFYDIYKKLQNIDNESPEKLAQMEEEAYRIKSAYYPELQERYWLTPEGFEKLPHEDEGMQGLITYRKAKLQSSKSKVDTLHA